MKRHLEALVSRRYATLRGLARLVLADLEHVTGRLRPFSAIDFARIRRFVFVCQGNVCRSCFAEYVARRHGIPAASFGLATESGQPAFGKAIATATNFGIDLGPHRVTAVEDFSFAADDLLVAMEVRQARRLVAIAPSPPVQITLIGLWSRPFRPHLHDPYEHGMDYFDTCFRILESGVDTLARRWRDAGAPDAPASPEGSRGTSPSAES